jgi:HD-GYP domain-containing protein (c-di-GMP phosphodiesterase class II)
MRLSDIYKRPDEIPEPQQPGKQGSTQPVTPTPMPARAAPPGTPTSKPPPAVVAQPTPQALEVARGIHTKLNQHMHGVVDHVHKAEHIPAEPLFALIDEFVQSLIETPGHWVGLAHIATPEPYIITHSLNVMILSVVLARGMEYSVPQMKDLAVKAYLHDLGMIQHMDLIDQPRQLTSEELALLRQHPLQTADLIERLIPGVEQGVCYAVMQEHERMDGSGYPEQMHDGEIEEDMRVIGVVDVYEAMTHPRSWRQRMTPREGIEHLLSPGMKSRFDPNVLRHLVTEIGIYPVGTWISMSSGESGRVLKTNPATPLRPVIEVLTNTEGEPLEEPRIVDISQHPTAFIKEFVGYDQS